MSPTPDDLPEDMLPEEALPDDALPEEDGPDPTADVLAAAFGAPKAGGLAAAPVPTRCGHVAIVGRPNVGKSTLLNALVGQKVSITSRKAQTTRHRITGIRTVGTAATGGAQFVFVDTPGFQTEHIVRGTATLNRKLNKQVQAAVEDVDLVLFLVEAGRFDAADAKVLALMPAGTPVVLVANKLDKVARRQDLLPWLQGMQARHPFAEFIPMSATRESDIERLLAILTPYLPEQAWLHEEDALTDRSERFLVAELIREKLFRLTGDELPYTSTVVIEKFEEAAPKADGTPMHRIAASIVVERDAHKGMVIGDGGERLKRIGTEARVELERLLGAKVFLELWVQVRSGWADDEARLRAYGYE